MENNRPLYNVFIGWDSRESIAADVCAHSIYRRTKDISAVKIKYLKHRDLRKHGYFARPWLVEGSTGDWQDLIDGRPFSTEFSHTRFLTPALMGYQGWALFMDCDMIFLSDVSELFKHCDDRYAVMCVKHQHKPQPNAIKMDGRAQLSYYRKNWSSFVLFNCSHPKNRHLNPERVNFMKGSDLHAFSWLSDEDIGSLPNTYNYIVGVSPRLPPEKGNRPDVIHYTEGGPWFDNYKNVPYGQFWDDEKTDFEINGQYVLEIESAK